VVVFCGIESVQRRNLRHDGFIPQVSLIEFFDEGFSDGSLSVVVIEDGGTVLCAHIFTLLVQCRRVMDGEENLQDFSVRDFSRIESHLNCLGMAGAVATDFLVGRINDGAACVAGNNVLNPIHLHKDCFHAPEATTSKGGNFCSNTLGHGLYNGVTKGFCFLHCVTIPHLPHLRPLAPGTIVNAPAQIRLFLN